ncbi:hypothetical protein [Blastococcus sp. CT_GayMR16]|uniref:hypothetical protein n=1 Tax=Blastococcus sp. CT_GayMR16 TaxID=2559607 RepID=UPI0010748390|nr:hypothetical protein [Blastococcus sp. CT_GayMR16]TFV90014.1 hypothetical protein E4P38_06160 [Blastococcus sp. CT_GayMR16]
MTHEPINKDHPDAQDLAGVNPPVVAADYPSETGHQLAEESSYEQVHPEVDHTPGKHPGAPFERASDYPAETGEELQQHRHGG